MLPAIPNCYAKVLESVSSFLFCATGCFQSWEQFLSFNENLKNVLKIRFCIKDIKLKQIFDEKLYGASEFESNLLQLVKNSQNNFRTCHVLNEKVHKTSNFELNTLQCVIIWIKFYIYADFELPVQYLRQV